MFKTSSHLRRKLRLNQKVFFATGIKRKREGIGDPWLHSGQAKKMIINYGLRIVESAVGQSWFMREKARKETADGRCSASEIVGFRY